MIEKQTYTLAELSALLGKDVQTVRKYLKQGRIPGEKWDGRWLLKKPAIDAWLAQQPVKRDEEQAA